MAEITVEQRTDLSNEQFYGGALAAQGGQTLQG